MAKTELARTRRTNREQEPQKPRRPYRLTPEGLASLRASAARVKPWERSTGPRTPDGKARSRMNALRHGERSAEAMATRTMLAGCLRMLRKSNRELADLTRQAAKSLD